MRLPRTIGTLLGIAMTTAVGKLVTVVTARHEAGPAMMGMRDLLKQLVPNLSFAQHKGSMGRVGVIGGSIDYTGAPYYAAAASLRFGGELAYVFCENSAAANIKSYSPELMVTPFYSAELIRQHTLPSASVIIPFLPRLHAVVIGPGLGRDEKAWAIVEPVIQATVAANIPIIIDADGLALLVDSRLHLIRGYARCILTPNKVEFDRLCQAALNFLPPEHEGQRGDLQPEKETHVRLKALCKSLEGVTVLVKGKRDVVSDGKFEAVLEIDEVGSPRRCGGQGDLLAGSLGVAAYWAFSRVPVDGTDDESTPNPALVASILASVVTRRAAEMAFGITRRATTTPDILEHIGAAFESVVPCVVE